MIEVKNIKKRFNERQLFDDFTYYFPNRGMIAICGPSGCGKTTLLNMMSGLLIPDSGYIKHSTVKINELNDTQLSLYRLRNFGFIFQDFKLFETETVFNNISLPLDSIAITPKKIKERVIDDLLSLVSLKEKKHQNINLLSGGEKQRVAIARSLINNPSVIFADEPTGALDEKNANQVMKILKTIASKSLVIIVSHDLTLMREYANKIIHMKDGKIINEETISEVGEKENLPIIIKKKKLKKPSIPIQFLFHHAIKKMKEKKWRMMMCDMVMSLSLIGVGAAISLTSSISTNIKKAYGEVLGEDRICINKKGEKKERYGLYSCKEDEVELISQTMESFVQDYGINYYLDYDNFCTNETPFSFQGESEIREIPIDSLSLLNVNEFLWMEDINGGDMFPSNVRKTGNNEVILGLDIVTIRDICFGLHIERSVTSLSGYLQYNELYLILHFENLDWGYEKTISFKVLGFLLEKENHIYHTNHKWNEHVFETLLGFPPTNYISGFSKYPWDLKKIYYLKMLSKNCESFLENAFYNIDLVGYVFEIANKNYYPKLYKRAEVEEINRLLVFMDYRDGIDVNYVPYIEKACPHLSNPIFASYGGYSIYPSSFMSGFSKPTYFSYDAQLIDETISSIEIIDEVDKIDTLPKGILTGYFANNDLDNVLYTPLNDSNTQKLAMNEVIISKEMAKKIYNSIDVVNSTLYLTFNNLDILISENKVRKEYINTSLIIKGVSDENKNIIHQTSDWAILFFQCKLGVSIFSLSSFSISYSVDSKKNMDDSITSGNKTFKQLEFYDPMSDFNLGVDEICDFIRLALLIFSIISIVVSIMLLSTCSYLHAIENKKDIGLARCLGLPKKESAKFIFSYSILTAGISFTLSSIELVGFTFFSMYAISNILQSSSVFTFNPLSLLVMFALTFLIAILSSIFFARKTTRMNPLEAIK